MKSSRIILIVLLSYLFVGSVYASEGKGLEIATEVDVRDKGCLLYTSDAADEV